MVRAYDLWRFLACTVCLAFLTSAGNAAAPALPYVIVFRSRSAGVTPARNKNAQTGGGYIQVIHNQPNVAIFLMRGAVAARAGYHDGSAAMQFELNQDFEIVPARKDLRPPQIRLSAWLLGTLNSTPRVGGTAEQAPGCAAVLAAGKPLLQLSTDPHRASAGENLLVNGRAGPFEAVVSPGGYTLHQTFALSTHQPKTPCHPGFTAADFDPDPELDAEWNTLLRPFRTVPHRDFGFQVQLRVVEDGPYPAINAPADEMLPPPTRKDKGTGDAKKKDKHE